MNGSTKGALKEACQIPYRLTLGSVSDGHSRFLFNVGEHLKKNYSHFFAQD